MALASLSLLTPGGLLVGLTALLPTILLLLVARRQARAATTIGLRPASARAVAPLAVVSATACVALGLAAAQPVVTTTETVSARTRSEVVFFVDVSRSMRASAGPGEPTRLQRARSAVERLRLAVPDVPAGISGLTDRALPYLFPTLDADVFSETLAQSVAVDSPPPLWSAFATVATSFAPMGTVMRNGFFGHGVRYRTCVLLTDGEARSTLGDPTSRGRRGCRLVVVRVGDGATGSSPRQATRWRPTVPRPPPRRRLRAWRGSWAARCSARTTSATRRLRCGRRQTGDREPRSGSRKQPGRSRPGSPALRSRSSSRSLRSERFA